MNWVIERAAIIAFNLVLIMLAWRYRYEIKAFVIQVINFINP
jgi:hypothetical protein